MKLQFKLLDKDDNNLICYEPNSESISCDNRYVCLLECPKKAHQRAGFPKTKVKKTKSASVSSKFFCGNRI